MDPLKVADITVSGARNALHHCGAARDSRDNDFMTGFGKQMSRVLLASLLAGALGLGGAAWAANPTAPSLKPAEVRQSTWMEAGQFSLLNRALDAADEGRWSEVRSAIGRLSDPGAQALLRWKMASDTSGMGFTELSKA